jgi:hypothetical protein
MRHQIFIIDGILSEKVIEHYKAFIAKKTSKRTLSCIILSL